MHGSLGATPEHILHGLSEALHSPSGADATSLVFAAGHQRHAPWCRLHRLQRLLVCTSRSRAWRPGACVHQTEILAAGKHSATTATLCVDTAAQAQLSCAGCGACFVWGGEDSAGALSACRVTGNTLHHSLDVYHRSATASQQNSGSSRTSLPNILQDALYSARMRQIRPNIVNTTANLKEAQREGEADIQQFKP